MGPSVNVVNSLSGCGSQRPNDNESKESPRLGHVISVRNASSSRLCALWRGRSIRQQLRVGSLGPGLVSVRINGDQRFLEKIGLSDAFLGHAFKAHGRQQLAYIALDESRFTGRVIADGSRGLALTQMNRADMDDLVSATGRTVVCINGGFFNHHRLAAADMVECASIGVSLSHGEKMPHLPLPDGYVDDYIKIHFKDGSLLETAPALSCEGQPLISEEKMREPRYGSSKELTGDRDPVIPGQLRHAREAHPRAAISASLSGDGRTRLVVGLDHGRRPLAEKRASDAGYTLLVWSRVMARIDRLETPANSSINLDGGGSAAVMVMMPDGSKTTQAQAASGRPIANFLAFVENVASS